MVPRRDIAILTASELADERERAREALTRGFAGALSWFAEVVAEGARRSARMEPTCADKLASDGPVTPPAKHRSEPLSTRVFGGARPQEAGER